MHYTNHPSGVECITIVGDMNFAIGNAFKYLFRIGDKDNPLQDAKKALWYIEFEIKRRQKLRFRWFAEADEYSAVRDGNDDIMAVLEFEHRYNGWLSSALERLYTAHVYGRGIEALEEAANKVHSIIVIQNYRETRAV